MPKGVYKRYLKPVADRFWEKVNKTDGCWLWVGALYKTGYGSICKGGRTGSMKAHRMSWEIHYGKIPNGMHVLHKCDNPKCVRPDHLFLGSHQDNMKDMANKGRSTIGDRNPSRLYPERRARGERCGASKLTEKQVKEIRLLAEHGEKQSKISKLFGICQSNVSGIINRKKWNHI